MFIGTVQYFKGILYSKMLFKTFSFLFPLNTSQVWGKRWRWLSFLGERFS